MKYYLYICNINSYVYIEGASNLTIYLEAVESKNESKKGYRVRVSSLSRFHFSRK